MKREPRADNLTTYKCNLTNTDSRYRQDQILPCPLCGATDIKQIRPWWSLSGAEIPSHTTSPNQWTGD